MKQAEVVEGIRLERERLIEFLRTISADDWTAPSLCSQWRVRDVVAHLVGNVADVIAQNLEGAGSEAYNNRQVEERAALTPAAILAEWEEKAPRLDAFFAGMDAELWEAPLPGLGGTIGWGVQRLLEDLWVHAHDVRLPLDEPAVAGPGTQATLEVMASEVALRCRSLAPEVGSIAVHAGDFTETFEAGGSIALRLEGDAVWLALAATGRVPLAETIADERLSASPAPPKGFADALNIYGTHVEGSGIISTRPPQ